MKTDEIKILLDAFYNGETSHEEELILLRYFESENVSEELLGEKEIFLQLFQSEENIEVPPTLESKLENLIDSLAERDEKKRSRNRKHLWIWAVSAAACIAILFSVGLYFNNRPHESSILAGNEFQEKQELKDTFTDPDQAKKEAEKALLLVAANLNKGMNQLELVSNNIDKTNEILDKTFNRKNK
ncbi:hypothetical protein [Dysgonomonas sp. ZJ279]|uniref:hypothetical protein n=1 Tax=Dysgonomonas sp. ZJ279 TaxID=2709796 RepID=UPI0013ED4D2C|nr:hypothetical protein [Dysgonomonas sp. ZJ279]